MTTHRSNAPRRPRLARGGTTAWVLAFLAIVAGLAGFELYALYASNRDHAPVPVSAPTAGAAFSANPSGAPVGDVERPQTEAVVGPRIVVTGWASAPTGIKAVELRVDGRTFAAKLGVTRLDVVRIRPDLGTKPDTGWEFVGDFTGDPPPAGADRRVITIVAVGNDGKETVLGRKSLVEPAALARWADFTPKDATPFYVLPALSGIDLNGASELDWIYQPYLSPTVRAGFRVPVLYLRTTKGAAHDFAFDPDWDPTRKCGARRIGDDSLNAVLAHSKAKSLPVLVTLNGGVWADAYCDVPDWDVNDRLEQDLANDQWNQNNEVMPDDYLKHLPGSMDAPELARSLTFNVYAAKVRHYKKRNLQEAGRILVDFAREHPALFVGVNLDPDTYLNPFFDGEQWYDYNPGTLRQFREWLSGTGPYAGTPAPGIPDLRAYRRPRPLTLADVNRIAGRKWRSWQDVDPPRVFPRKGQGPRPFWQDPWVAEWEVFRRHLVHLHYSELAQWLVEVGIPPDRIWTAQGLMAPQGEAMPFAVDIASPPRNYDSGGMSVAGAKPVLGHLGVILYGAAAVNDVRMENGKSLFATLAQIDPKWAVVEYNTADLRHPDGPPGFPAAYRGLRDLWNFGARYVSPMAWNGSNGASAGQPGYTTFTAWRNTPLEEAARDFMLARAGLPLGALLYTFGTPTFADGDGWTADVGALILAKGYVRIEPDANDRVVLLSPKPLPAGVQGADTFVLGFDEHAGVRRVRVQGRRSADSGWETLADGSGAALRTTAAGVAVKRNAGAKVAAWDQLRIEVTFAANTARVLQRIAVIPGD
jgi:hypothetical protein